MNLRNSLRVLRARWMIVCAVTLIAAFVSIAVTLLTTPLYQASTRLFVSTSSGTSIDESYQGNLLSQQRVLSYTELVQGQTLAQRTIEKLGLDMSADELTANIKASAKPDTVLINVSVSDGSPIRARDIANALSDEFVAMVKELESPEDGSNPDARVVVEQRATIPAEPVSPNRLRNVTTGLAVGFLIGIGCAFGRDYLDNTVKNRETLEQITRAGLIGTVPLDKQRRSSPSIVFENDNSAIAEAFRKLRTNLQFLAVDNPPRVIMVASSLPGEGKSTTAINIALALAEAEHKVVLVDGDMRRPMLGKYLNVVGSVGFSTVLSGGASLSEVLQKTHVSGLSVLTSGPVPPNPSELLGSLAAKKVLSTLRNEFDYVIVDSSPLLAVTDATILAASSDAVLMIARYGQTKREQLAQAVLNLEGVGVLPLGAVFAMTPARGDSSYGYDYYGYGETSRPTSAAK